jgi:hypothetical protein
MVTASSNGKKKKKTKKEAKRKPLNLQPTYNSKFRFNNKGEKKTNNSVKLEAVDRNSYETISFDMFPSNENVPLDDDTFEKSNDRYLANKNVAGEYAIGDFHMHR